MESKKKDSNIGPVIVAIIALIVLSTWYHYLGDYTIKKVDAALGLEDTLRINDLVIEKGYNEVQGLKKPEVKISYSTSRVSESFIKINTTKSEVLVSKTFSKTITLSSDFFGKNIEVEIYAKDNEGKEAFISRTITIPNNPEPVIAILNI